MMKTLSALLLLMIVTASWCDVNAGCLKADKANKVYRANKLYEKSLVAIENDLSDKNYPVQLALYTQQEMGSCKKTIVFKFSAEGSAPVVKTLFFINLKNKINLVTLVAWDINNRGDGTYGTLYQIYAFEDSGENGLVENPFLKNKNSMTGIDGYSNGKPSEFAAKDSTSVKKLLASILK